MKKEFDADDLINLHWRGPENQCPIGEWIWHTHEHPQESRVMEMRPYQEPLPWSLDEMMDKVKKVELIEPMVFERRRVQGVKTSDSIWVRIH